GPNGNLWYTANAANQIGCMTPKGGVLGEYPIPTAASGARCIASMSNGRLYFTQWDAGQIGEVILAKNANREDGIMKKLAVMCATLALGSAPGLAQTYPEKPIRMVVSIAAGSVTDVIMRAAANELQPRLKQTLVIENQGGAAGILGAQSCARATGDGYTICIIYHSTMSYNPLLFTKLPYNPDDFVPIARLFFLTEGLFVSSA